MGWAKKQKKGQKLSCVKLAFGQTTHVDIDPEILHAGSCLGDSYIFQFLENWLQGLGAVEGRKSPSPTDLAYGLYNSLCYHTSRDWLTDIVVSTHCL